MSDAPDTEIQLLGGTLQIRYYDPDERPGEPYFYAAEPGNAAMAAARTAEGVVPTCGPE
jgi:hypothetical protein